MKKLRKIKRSRDVFPEGVKIERIARTQKQGGKETLSAGYESERKQQIYICKPGTLGRSKRVKAGLNPGRKAKPSCRSSELRTGGGKKPKGS